MLISENLRLLTIDMELLASNLQKIITSCLETILPKFLKRPKVLETLSKLYNQFSHELARISKFNRVLNVGSNFSTSQSVKQTIYLLKSIKVVISKLKLARQRSLTRFGSGVSSRGFAEEIEDEKASLNQRIEHGIELMKSPFANFDTFPGFQYGAKKGREDIYKSNSNYNIHPMQNCDSFQNALKSSPGTNVGGRGESSEANR